MKTTTRRPPSIWQLVDVQTAAIHEVVLCSCCKQHSPPLVCMHTQVYLYEHCATIDGAVLFPCPPCTRACARERTVPVNQQLSCENESEPCRFVERCVTVFQPAPPKALEQRAPIRHVRSA